MTRVGFAGLGRMGALMATNLARAGFELTGVEPQHREGLATCRGDERCGVSDAA